VPILSGRDILAGYGDRILFSEGGIRQLTAKRSKYKVGKILSFGRQEVFTIKTSGNAVDEYKVKTYLLKYSVSLRENTSFQRFKEKCILGLTNPERIGKLYY
jgi:hypothetical protein